MAEVKAAPLPPSLHHPEARRGARLADVAVLQLDRPWKDTNEFQHTFARTNTRLHTHTYTHITEIHTFGDLHARTRTYTNNACLDKANQAKRY